MKKKFLSRRAFLAQSAAAAAAPLILPTGVLAAHGRPGANDRVVTGHIGIGGMGSGHLGALKDQAGALCDVDQNHLKRAREIVGRAVDTYTDYRRILDRQDIDAVVIASPDHWHAVQMVHACEAGKDVYVEKPACNTIAEGQAMMRAANRFGRVVQVGSQGRSTPAAHAACTYIRNGQLGQVQRVDCWHYENPVGGLKPDCDPPPELDWDMWLGPARWVPYNPDRVHFNFRWFLDFGGGNIRDRGAHVFSVVLWCLNLDHAGPVRVSATGEPPHEGIWDCPTKMDVTYEFKNPDITLTWSQPGTKPVDSAFGAVYTGTKDKLIVLGGDGGCKTEDKAMNYAPPADGQRVFKSPGHRENWFECIKTRQKPLMNIEAAYRVAALCVLGNVSYRLGRPLEWDPVKEIVAGDEQANRMLNNPGRGPWRV
ncbi:MAG: Gfo/Idh/MocA family oxidoreductase [Candidatus Hydrogenedentes bacterium]|nr:Gfo/Idh/MocA family oxidoreductase [Candidatus Hydrogenedentota bacterium]